MSGKISQSSNFDIQQTPIFLSHYFQNRKTQFTVSCFVGLTEMQATPVWDWCSQSGKGFGASYCITSGRLLTIVCLRGWAEDLKIDFFVFCLNTSYETLTKIKNKTWNMKQIFQTEQSFDKNKKNPTKNKNQAAKMLVPSNVSVWTVMGSWYEPEEMAAGQEDVDSQWVGHTKQPD